MTVLSRMARLAIAPETQAASYAAPQFTVTFDKATYRQVIMPLRDTELRGSDSWLQDMQQGPWYTQWEVPSDGYPDLAGWWLRAIIGPDTCTPGITTQVSAPAPAGAQSVSLAARPSAGTVLMVGAGNTLEYARIGTPAGSGPYACPVTSGPLLYAHAATEAVLSQSVHTFSQEFVAGFPTYSLTMSDGTGPLGWPGCAMTGLVITITPGGYVSLKASLSGYPAFTVPDFTYDATPAQPMAGWEWQIFTASEVSFPLGVCAPVVRPISGTGTSTGLAPSTRGERMRLSLTRQTDVMPMVMAQQAPGGIWPAGALKVNGTYQALYESQLDMQNYLQYVQLPAVHALVQPDLLGGSSLTLTLPSAGTWTGEADMSGPYLSSRYSVSGIASPVAGPSVEATLVNFWPAAY